MVVIAKGLWWRRDMCGDLELAELGPYNESRTSPRRLLPVISIVQSRALLLFLGTAQFRSGGPGSLSLMSVPVGMSRMRRYCLRRGAWAFSQG